MLGLRYEGAKWNLILHGFMLLIGEPLFGYLLDRSFPPPATQPERVVLINASPFNVDVSWQQTDEVDDSLIAWPGERAAFRAFMLDKEQPLTLSVKAKDKVVLLSGTAQLSVEDVREYEKSGEIDVVISRTGKFFYIGNRRFDIGR